MHLNFFQYTIVSCGMMAKDVEKIESILNNIPEIRAICLDVANGYSEHFVEFVKEIRTKFPEHILMVSLSRFVWEQTAW